MISSRKRSLRLSLVLLASCACWANAASAQDGRANLPPGAVVQPLNSGATDELHRYLAEINENPRSVSALVGAGRAALELRDPQAALTFFSRANEEAPRDARVKAGMASAMARLEQPEAALSLFGEAVQLGAPEAEIAGDRGLAYDAVGDPARAQRDYAQSLRNREDPEIRRRMALSLAISGQREEALRMIHEQLRDNDRAAWRTQAFVLALTGDAAGANRIARQVMPAGTGQALAPFLARLATLTPTQKALAVHFGHFPANGGGTRMAAAGNADRPPTEARARPDASGATVERRQWPVSPIERAAGSHAREQVAAREVRRTAPTPTPTGRFQPNAPETGSTSIPASSSMNVAPGFSLAPGGGEAPVPAAEPPVVSVPARPFAEIAQVVNALPSEERPTPQAGGTTTERQRRDAEARENERRNRPAAPPTRTASTARPPTPAPQRERARPAQPANPSRHWVQVAGGANRAALPREFNRLRERAPRLLRNRAAYTTPLNATNRLLVGPFPSAGAAQDFVNQLSEEDIAAFAWTSPAGQEIERLQTPR